MENTQIHQRPNHVPCPGRIRVRYQTMDTDRSDRMARPTPHQQAAGILVVYATGVLIVWRTLRYYESLGPPSATASGGFFVS